MNNSPSQMSSVASVSPSGVWARAAPESVRRRTRLRIVLATALPLVCSLPAGAQAPEGPGPKGRYLVVMEGHDLRDYRGALFVLEPTQIESDREEKERIDQKLCKISDHTLTKHLKKIKLFDGVVSEMPDDRDRQGAVLWVAPRLTLQYGSRGKRFASGAITGRSKIHIQVDFIDAGDDSVVAYYNGYGAGIGIGGMFGGGVKHMSKDDLKENYDRLEELLRKEMKRKKKR